jgi:hypothetical protein
MLNPEANHFKSQLEVAREQLSALRLHTKALADENGLMSLLCAAVHDYRDNYTKTKVTIRRQKMFAALETVLKARETC